jgi:ABC-type glycerol-3-phosphate transport system permease component
MSRSSRREKLAVYAIALAALAFFMIPVAWIVSTSFKRQADVQTIPPTFVFTPTLDNYASIFAQRQTDLAQLEAKGFLAYRDFLPSYGNSLIVGVLSTFLAVALGALAAYAFARLQFRGRRVLMLYILLTRMLPPLGILIPVFLIYSNLHLLDSQLSLAALYLSFNISVVVWMMQGFIADVPVDLEESAMVDGASRLGAMWRVTLPLVAPGLAATATLCLLLNWNEFLFALMLTGQHAKTAPVGAAEFSQSFKQVLWGSLSAAGTLITLPVIVFALLTQRHLVRGLTAGAVNQ